MSSVNLSNSGVFASLIIILGWIALVLALYTFSDWIDLMVA